MFFILTPFYRERELAEKSQSETEMQRISPEKNKEEIDGGKPKEEQSGKGNQSVEREFENNSGIVPMEGNPSQKQLEVSEFDRV